MLIVDDCQAVVGERRTQDVLAQCEPALLVVGGNLGRAVEVEPSVLPAQVALGYRMSVGVEHDTQGRRARRSRVGQGVGG